MKCNHLLLLVPLLSQSVPVCGMMNNTDSAEELHHSIHLLKYESSHMSVGGNIIIDAKDEDIDIRSKAEVYTSECNKKSGFLGFNSRSVKKQSAEFTKTNLNAGKTLKIESKEGGIKAQGSNFISTTGDVFMKARDDDIELDALKVTLHHQEDQSSRWGLSGSSKSGYH